MAAMTIRPSETHHPSSIFPPTYKVVIVGKYGVGKTSLLWRYLHNEFRSVDSRVTIVDVEKKRITYSERQVELEFWDTAGKEKFRTISPSYYNGAQAIMVVYDITDPDSFIEVKQYWINEIFGFFGEEADHHIPIMLIGTKLDLVDKYDDGQVIVRPCDVQELKGKHERLIGPIQCSAKTGRHIDRVFDALTKELFDRDLAGTHRPILNPTFDAQPACGLTKC